MSKNLGDGTPSQEPGRGSSAHIPEVIGQVVAALVGSGFGGAPGAVVGAAVTPFALMLAKKSWAELGGRRAVSVTTMLDGAASDLGEDLEDMLADATKTDATAQHLSDAMQAAANTFNEQKLRGLAAALAAGLRDGGTKVDIENLVVRALADLEAAHIQALAQLRGTSLKHPRALRRDRGVAGTVYSTLERHGLIASDQEQRQRAAIEKAVAERLAWWESETVRKARTRSSHTRKAPALDLDLEGRWYITPFGAYCLRYLTARVEDDPQSDESDKERG